jgi:hypothetical protein
MKKIMFLAAAAVLFTMGFSSCSKCQLCTKPNSNEVRICEKDYNSNTAYGFTIDTYEASGYACKGSL